MEDTTSPKLDEQQYVILSGPEARPRDGQTADRDQLDLSAVPRALPEDGVARLHERKTKSSRLSAGSDGTIDSIESDQDITLSSQSNHQTAHLQDSNGHKAVEPVANGASDKEVQPEVSTVKVRDDNASGPEILTARNGVAPILNGLDTIKRELEVAVNGKGSNGADAALALEQEAERIQVTQPATTNGSLEKGLADGGEHKKQTPAPEPIAICGMAMRYPGGVRTAEAFWDVIANGKDLRGPIPADRFNIDGFDGKLGRKGQVDTRHGYFLDEDLGLLDTSFFSMSKLEVEKTDPQQRLLLEVARECFDSAGETDYRGRLVGCYVGTFGEDWLHMQSREPQFTGGYNFSGDLMIANRLSYEYDLKGPSMVIKTGCSASLVGLHEACMSLQTGGCTSAIVAGTSLLMGPTIYSTMTSEGVLSPEGSCKTFDAEANGFARAEGINAVYLKRLDDAIRDGNPIRAVIRNSGTNSDGKSQGLLNPSSAAQEALMRKLYQDAGLNPADTPFIECHGTGTPTGDPIETHAVGNLFKDRGIYIGSSKPNFGHSEGASGLTGLIKAVLALENKTIPPNIKFGKPNPKIKFDEFNLAVPLKPVPWPTNRAERVSINSFGIGGTNAHCIVDSAKSYIPSYETNGFHSKAGSAAQLLVCSANSQDAVKKVVEDSVAYLQAHPERSDDLAYTLARRREPLPHRSFVVVTNGNVSEAAPSVKAPQQAAPLALVFTGQGAQWPQMGKQLLESDPSFRDDIKAMDDILAAAKIPPTWTLEDELLRPKETSNVYRAELSQPLCTAVQLALVNSLRRAGIAPDAVVGHSSGEIAAAYAAGALSQREAILASYYRGLTTKYQELKGGMAAVGLSAAETAEFLVDGVVVAAENSPSATTISGDLDKLEQVIAAVKSAKPDILARKLQVDMAYHSHHMAALARHYLSLLQVEMESGEDNDHRPKIPMFSSVTSQLYTQPLSPQYWVDNLVSPVKFLPAVNALLKELPQALFLEVGPHSQMAGPLRQICAEARASCNYISTMIRGADCAESFSSAIGQLWQQGVSVAFASLFPRGKVLTDLPLYPWDHSTKYWYESRIAKEWRFRQYGHHALLGQRIPELSELEPAWRCVLDLEDVPWLADHKVRDDIIFPFAGYVSMAGEAIRQISGVQTGYSVRHVIVPTALVLNVSKPVELLTSLRKRKLTDSAESEYWEFTISSYSGSTWMRHCEGTVKPTAERLTDSKEISSLPRKISASRWYKMLGHVGLNYGPEFQGMTSLQTSVTSSRAVGEITGKVEKPFLFHPATMDTCFQLVIAAAAQGLGRNLKHLVVPTLIEEIDVFPGTEHMIAEAWGSAGEADVGIECVAEGQVALRLRGVRLNPLEDDRDVSNKDVHAAARLEWYPDVDFMDVGPLFKPPTIDTDVKLTVEEMVLLCTLDSADRVEGLTAGQPHFNNFREWLHRERQRASDGTYPPIIKDTLPYTKLTKEERKAAILERADKICADPSFGDVARGIVRIWENTEDLFTGKKDTLEILMEDGVLTGIYNCISFGFSKFVKMLAISKPKLRILEVGAGTGGTTEMILRDLVSTSKNPLYSTYTFTDISAGFFPQATERFSYAPNMEYKVFDISACPFEQGYTPESYDLILAPNVVHATPSLYATLSNLQPLLKPGGQLVLTEVCAVARGPGYIFGNFSGWWMGEADGRKWEPYIFLDRWDAELKGAGFTGVDTAVVDAEEPYQYCAAIVSRTAAKQNNPELPAVTVLCEPAEQQATQTLISHLQSHNIDVSVVRFGEGSLPAGQPVLATVDLETPFFDNITKERFEQFQALCREHADQKLLWLMPPTQINCTDPRHAPSLGAVRGAAAELGLPFHTLEISTAEEDFAGLVLKVLRKVHRVNDDNVFLRPDREYAVDNGVVKIPRFGAFDLEDEVSRKSATKSVAEKELAIGKPGLLETLHWVDVPAKTLGDDQVEIESRAVGLNFRDVMVAMGVLSFEGKHPLGIEVSGIVSRVGSNVKNVAVGDRVVGVALDGAFSTKAVVDSVLCTTLPESFSFEEAATIPCVYATALYALYTVGQLTSETSVLIHSSCGGIGHAAVALCKAVGAEIFVTVGSEVKAQYAMDTYGLPRNRIFHSRDESFVAGVMRETNGQGVDIVLNSLSGKLLHASWKCVAEFGKLIELGKRDLVGFGKLDMEPFLMNRSYCCVDLAHMIQKKPKQVGKILDQVMDMCRDGRIKPMDSITLFEAADIEQTFRHLQKGDHIGKAVVRIPADASLIPSTNAVTATTLDSEASYLLTGGLGGLGRAIAVWMAEHGARNFVFLSRSAGTTASDREFLHELRSMGCTAAAVAGKAQDMDAVKSAIALAPSPIKGVIHMAMVLRDQAFADMPHEDWCAAIDPKVNGAWNLHNALEGQKLDFFISTSSGVTTFADHSGQSNYSAANCFLEAFTIFRRSQGLPATVLNICPVDDVGFIADNNVARKKLRSQGLYFLTEKEFMDYMELLILNQLPEDMDCSRSGDNLAPWCANGNVVMGLRSEVPLDDPKCSTEWRRDCRMATYHNLRDSSSAGEGGSGSSNALKTFLASASNNPELLDGDEAVGYLAQEIGLKIFAFMMRDESEVDVSLSLAQIGMDSLMAIELRRWWKQTFALDISTLEIMGSGTLRQLGGVAAEGLKKKFAGET